MGTQPHVRYISGILLLVLLTVTLNCVHESVHALQHRMLAACDHGSVAPHGEQSAPDSQHTDNDCCTDCGNCAAHAPLAGRQLAIAYAPLVSTMKAPEPFRHLPEVFLAKFVPPQNLS